MTRENSTELWRFRGFVRDDFISIAGASDGAHLAVLDIPGQPRSAFLLEGLTGEVQHICHDKLHRDGPLCVAFSPDGTTLAVGYAPCDIILWNARTGERRELLEGHSNWVVSLAFSANSRRLISGGDGMILQNRSAGGWTRREQEIFYVATECLTPNARKAYLDAVCGPNTDAPRHVETLLEAAEQAGSFLSDPALLR